MGTHFHGGCILTRVFSFLGQELGWSTAKVDDLLLPVIHKMGQRTASTAGKQSDLTTFFDTSNTGTYAPRKKQAYASKRLQKIVADYRKERKAKGLTPGISPVPGLDRNATEERSSPVKGKRKRSRAKKSTTPTDEEHAPPAKKKRAPARRKRKVADEASDDGDGEVQGSVTSDAAPNRGLRPRRGAAGGLAKVVESESEDGVE